MKPTTDVKRSHYQVELTYEPPVRRRKLARLLHKLGFHSWQITADNLYTYTKTCSCSKTKTIRRNM